MEVRNSTKARRWVLVAFLSMSALLFAQLFEQIVFVPNWLIGDVATNVEHFRRFKHAADPGMYYFPVAFVVFVSHMILLRVRSFSDVQRKPFRDSLVAFSIVFAITVYVIVGINVPVFDNPTVPDEHLAAKLKLWAILNVFRIVLPMYAVYRLSSVLKLQRNSELQNFTEPA